MAMQRHGDPSPRRDAWTWRGLIGLIVLVLGSGPGAEAQSRTFTDTTGRTLEAEIMDATESTVQVRRADGRVFAIVLETLSAEDRAHVAAWRTERAFAFGGIEVAARRVRLDTERVQTRSSTKKAEDWCYKLTIANKSRADLDGLTIEYRVFYIDDTAKADRNELPWKRKNGRTVLATLAAGTSTEVQTITVPLEVVVLKPGHTYSGTRKRRVEDTLAGIWVRVRRGNEVLHEFADPTSLMKSEPW